MNRTSRGILLSNDLERKEKPSIRVPVLEALSSVCCASLLVVRGKPALDTRYLCRTSTLQSEASPDWGDDPSLLVLVIGIPDSDFEVQNLPLYGLATTTGNLQIDVRGHPKGSCATDLHDRPILVSKEAAICWSLGIW